MAFKYKWFIYFKFSITIEFFSMTNAAYQEAIHEVRNVCFNPHKNKRAIPIENFIFAYIFWHENTFMRPQNF